MEAIAVKELSAGYEEQTVIEKLDLSILKGKININNYNKYKNGILYLKGGDLKEELKELGKKSRVFEISEYFEEEFFETKMVVHIAMT